MATAASIAEVQKAYIAYYGRPADPTGLNYWANRVDAEGGIDSLIGQFGTSAEASARYGSLSQADAIEAIYQQAFGRAAEASGKAFYLEGLLSGQFTLVTLARDIIGGATGSDATVSAAKLAAAQAFTDYLVANPEADAAYDGDNASANARNWLAGVTNEATVTSQTAAIATTISTIGETPTNPGATYTLTSGTSDSFVGTANDDTFNATTANTLNSGDILSDNSVSDNDVLNATLNIATAAPKLTNIETINLTGQFLATGLDLTNVAGSNKLVASTQFNNGTVTLSKVSTTAVSSIEVDESIGRLSITSSDTGTRDVVSVKLPAEVGGATAISASITGVSGGADSYSVQAGSGASIGIATFAAADSFVLENEAGSRLNLQSMSALGLLSIRPSGDLTVSVTTSLASGTVVDTSGGNLTLSFTGDSTLISGDDLVRKSGDGSFTFIPGKLIAASQLGGIAADNILVDLSPGSAVAVNIASDSMLTLGASASITVGKGSATGAFADTGLDVSIQLDASTGPLTLGSSIGAAVISSITGRTVSITELEAISSSGITDVFQFVGENSITVTTFSATEANQILDARSMSGKLTVTTGSVDAGSLVIYGGSTGDTVSVAAPSAGVTGIVVYGEGGNDVITQSTSIALAAKIYGGEGDDTITGGAGVDTLYGGAGSDKFVLAAAAGDANQQTISDFVVGEDVLVLRAKGDSPEVNVANVTGASSIYNFAGISVKLTGLTDTDFSSSVQFGDSLNNPLAVGGNASTGTATIVAGSLNDYFTIATGTSSATVTLTLGLGADSIILSDAGDVNGSAGLVLVKDFDLSSDTIILTGSVGNEGTINPFAITPSSGAYLLGSASITLQSGGTALSNTDISSAVRFGHSTGATDSFVIGAVSTDITLGSGVNYLTVASADGTVISFKTTSTLGYIDSGTSMATDGFTVSFEGLLGGTSKTAMVADQAKLSDAATAHTYIFARGSDGAGDSSVTYSGGFSAGITGASLSNVAEFLNANLGGMASGERYVAIINDVSGATTTAYAYHVAPAGSSVSDTDITLIAIFDNAVTKDGLV